MKQDNVENQFCGFAEQSLLLQAQRIERKLQGFDNDELSHGGLAPSELGSRSWEENIRITRHTIKRELSELLDQTREALSKIKLGIYGKCEACGKIIEEGRLKIMPTAQFCLGCK